MEWHTILTRILRRNAASAVSIASCRKHQKVSRTPSCILSSAQQMLDSQSNPNGPELEQIVANVTRADKLFDQGNVLHSARPCPLH